MSAISILFLIISAVVVWGGLIASIVYLVAKPEVRTYSEGGAGGDDVG